MKIKSINQISFEISTDTVTLVTDPLAYEYFGIKFPKNEADVIAVTQKKYSNKQNILKGFDKLVGKNRDVIYEVNGAGEYEISQMLIQRPMNSQLYMFDSGYSRIVYLGLDSKDVDIEVFKDLGDVEVLIIPIGAGDDFPSYEKLQDIITEVEPGTIVPYGYKNGDLSKENLKTKEEFIHYFGYTNISEEKTLKVAQRESDQEIPMNIVFLS
jgi:L-ascorbate metabolism protein UlaG (beta-lactamase superfamily)